MNIFVLDTDPQLAAQYHCDKHVVKMILETAQMLSAVNRYYGLDQGYKVTHLNHPCTVWARQHLNNYFWLYDLGFYLNQEYRTRYDKNVDHKSFTLMESLDVPSKIPGYEITCGNPPTNFVQCMPDECKRLDPVEAYRLYYKTHKSGFAKWEKLGNVPYWWNE